MCVRELVTSVSRVTGINLVSALSARNLLGLTESAGLEELVGE
jgi:hypothetical protein